MKPSSSKNSRMGFWVNIAILVTLAIVLLSPTGVIGSRIAAVYDRWSNQRAVARAWPTLSDAPSRLVAPSGASQRTIVEFIDYECPSCRRIAESVSAAVTSGDVELVVRHLPLVSIHPSARSAAQAAVCSEQYGMFAEAHTSLLNKSDWEGGADWGAWASSIGIEDTTSFKSCLMAQSTSDRIEEDGRLARSLGVTGTPTFVTESGVFRGEQGFALAVAAGDGRLAESQKGSPHTIANLSRPLFDSGEHPNPAVSSFGSLGRGAFLNDQRIVLLDGQRLLFVNLSTGDVAIAGGDGDGPGEFRAPGGGLGWFPSSGGIAVWDPMLGRITRFSEIGELVDSRRIEPSTPDFRGILTLYNPVGMFSDGSLVFEDYPEGVRTAGDTDEVRFTVHLIEMDTEKARPIVEFAGNQGSDLLFGARSYAVVTDDRVVVADTDSDSIEVYGRGGEPLFSIPMPGERMRVHKRHLDLAQEDARIRAEESAQRRARLLASAGLPTQALGSDDVGFQHRDISPPIDMMRADGDGRLWVRRYVMPGDETQRWSSWDGNRQLFWLEMPASLDLMDARGDLLLLRVRDAFDVPRAVVRRMIFEPGA